MVSTVTTEEDQPPIHTPPLRTQRAAFFVGGFDVSPIQRIGFQLPRYILLYMVASPACGKTCVLLKICGGRWIRMSAHWGNFWWIISLLDARCVRKTSKAKFQHLPPGFLPLPPHPPAPFERLGREHLGHRFEHLLRDGRGGGTETHKSTSRQTFSTCFELERQPAGRAVGRSIARKTPVTLQTPHANLSTVSCVKQLIGHVAPFLESLEPQTPKRRSRAPAPGILSPAARLPSRSPTGTPRYAENRWK